MQRRIIGEWEDFVLESENRNSSSRKEKSEEARRGDSSAIDNDPGTIALIFDNSSRVPPAYVTDIELARMLSISVNTIRKWRSQGKIIPRKFGRSVRYVVAEVVAMLEKKGKDRHAKQRR